MNVRIFKIADGNDTALVWGASNKGKTKIVSNLMRVVEQVGFVDDSNGVKINMMGDELCINSCMATGFAYPAESSLKINNNLVKYRRLSNGVELRVKLKSRVVNDNLVLFDDIGYIFFEGKAPSKNQVSKLAVRYKLPAFGAINYHEGAITPYVYVVGSNTYTRETSCGSCSIATFLLKGTRSIKQPSGNTINVDSRGGYFYLTAEVQEIIPSQKIK